MKTNPQIDAYIAKAQPFAQPVLEYLRKVVHQACNSVDEAIKWSFPHFNYNGKILCSMAAFKQHCAFGFWLAAEMKTMDAYRKRNTETTGNGMGHFGKIKSISDLPAKRELVKMVKDAMALMDKGVAIKRPSPQKSVELPVPEELEKALSKNKTAKNVFEKFTPSHRKEYIMWITGTKTNATREKRIATAIEWIAGGKGSNRKFEKK